MKGLGPTFILRHKIGLCYEKEERRRKCSDKDREGWGGVEGGGKTI